MDDPASVSQGHVGPAAREYPARLESARVEAEREAAAAARVSNLRLAVFAVIAVLGWLVFATGTLGLVWLAPPALGFAVLVVWHDRLLQDRERAERRAVFYERGLARLSDGWSGGGTQGVEFETPEHPYAADLDLFGPGSLFELLCIARTREGERALADWLLTPARPDVVRARQQAVEELRPRLDLREDLATLGAEVRPSLHAEAVRGWGAAPPRVASALPRLASRALPALSFAALVAWLGFGAAPAWWLGALVAQLVGALLLRSRVREILRDVDLPARDLELLVELLARVERERFEAPVLARLRGVLDVQGVAASRRIAGLRLRIDLLDARRNQLFAPIALLLSWTTNVALSIERWRVECSDSLGAWIDAMGELEALASLSGYAYEHPDHPYPEITEGAACYEGRALGHPLLPGGQCITNDVSLGEALRVMVVSGSNMSGKSTLLRTVGANAVLAFAGAPVRAASLRLSPLAIGASIRVQDSLQEGRSRFYAEIRRLRQVVDLAEAGSTLFLLDEILHGTNSHVGWLGGWGVVGGLVERGALGLVTTHDLALVKIADSLDLPGANVHFEDHLEDGRIAFDYQLRPGVVRKSNALALMRAVGLEV